MITEPSPQGRGRRAVLLVDGWAGRRELSCRVIGETPNCFRIEVDTETRLPRRTLMPGESALVPRLSVRFLPPELPAPVLP